MAVLFSLMTLSKSARFVLPVLEPQLQLPEARMFETLKNSTTFSTCRLSSLVGLNSYGRHVQPQDLDIKKWGFYKHQMIRAACVLMPATISNKYTSLGFSAWKNWALSQCGDVTIAALYDSATGISLLMLTTSGCYLCPALEKIKYISETATTPAEAMHLHQFSAPWIT